MPSTTAPKPRVFVGSSVESLDVAYAIQENLEHVGEVTVWTQGVFDLSRTTIHGLMQAVDTFDFAIFVFAPDDVVKMRQETFKAARDNVVFELGLFTGGLGEDRTFMILPRGTEGFHLPTDLAGITPGTYEPNRRDGNLVAALGPACTRVKRAMEEAGVRSLGAAGGAGLATPVAAGLSEELRDEIGRMIREQESRIEAAFERFEGRVTAMIESRQETAKAPRSRLTHLISAELSLGARLLLREIALIDVHLTRNQYAQLMSGGISSTLDELRRASLLVPLTAADIQNERMPVYYFPPENARTIRAIAKELPMDDAHEHERLRRALDSVGYLPA